MLATLIEKPFDSNEWIFEIKWDGYRTIAEIQKDSVQLYSRNDLSFNSQFPGIVESLKKMQITAVLDGEIVVLDEQGRSQFRLLQQYPKYKNGILVYYVFDILYFEGYELLGIPLITRKKLLNQILSFNSGDTKVSNAVPGLYSGIGRTPDNSEGTIINSTDGSSYIYGSSIKNIKISGHIEKEGIAKYTYEQALDFVKIIAKLINIRQPDLTSLERPPDKRHNKVYLDCYQNRIGQTVAAPYCIRPRKGAPVSTPLQWEDLDKNFQPADFNMKNIFHRLDRIGDIWKEVLGTGIDLENCLEKLKNII